MNESNLDKPDGFFNQLFNKVNTWKNLNMSGYQVFQEIFYDSEYSILGFVLNNEVFEGFTETGFMIDVSKYHSVSEMEDDIFEWMYSNDVFLKLSEL